VDVSVLPAFLLAVLVIAASPGPAMALILQRAGLHGFRAAVPTVLGIEAGLFLWALAAGLGVAALVAASEVAFVVLKVAGAVFLAYLGIRALRAGWALRDREGREPMPTVPDPANRLASRDLAVPAPARRTTRSTGGSGGRGLRRGPAARRAVLLSVGYAACHWCHVMAHESFEDERSRRPERALRQHQGRPRGAARRRRRLHGGATRR
jgi:hypothetical protein